MTANKVIGQCLREAREGRGRTQMQLAEALGRPQSFVSKIESGERSLHFSEVFAYARALEMPAEQLVQLIDEELEAVSTPPR